MPLLHFFNRKNPLLFEKDGSLNLGWLLAGATIAVGLGISIRMAALNNTAVLIAALGFDATIVVALLIGAYPIAKAKILAKSEVLKASMQSFRRPQFGVNTEEHDDSTL